MIVHWLNRPVVLAGLLALGGYGIPAQTSPTTSIRAGERLPRTNLLIFHDRKGEVRPVKTKSDWLKRRAEIIRGFESIAGPLPGREKRCRLDMRVDSITNCGSYERWLVSYQSEPGSRVPAYLSIPAHDAIFPLH